MYTGFKTISDNRLQDAIDVINDWSKGWGLPLSIQKTKVLHLGKDNFRCSYSIGGARIQTVNEIKELGFLLNGALSFDEHCKSIAARADQRLFLLFKTLWTKDPRLLTRAYKVFVRSLLEYGTVFIVPIRRRSCKV